MTIRATSSYVVAILMIGLVGCVKPLLPHNAPIPTTGPTTQDSWAWSSCLHENVRQGRVNYARLAEHSETLDRVLSGLATSPEPSDNGNARTARLINAYNALAMRAGLEVFRRAGNDPRRATAPSENAYRFRLYGWTVTLADIRRRLLAGPTPDVRILLALCPARADIPLSDQPFDADTLDQRLADIATASMANPAIVEIDHENRVLRITDVIGRNRPMFRRWYRHRAGTDRGTIFNAILALCDDAGRDQINTAIGYRILVRPPERRLNVHGPAAPKR